MFVPGDPRFDEILKLATQATGPGLRDQDRPRWRELVTQLLGELIDKGHIPERRRQLRAALELEVDILAPDEVASLATSSIGAGGLALRIKEILPLGTLLDLSIKLEQRKVPLFARVQVVYSRPGEVGAAFVDLFQGDRELLEGIAVTALLARAALE
ncbi:MAG TPA: PilZ domain-containing protein [Myxococcales bacterium]|jgi:hypothetical protein|nr:PilZ domain-containing protein [Myxococcales bacterium]